MIEWKWLIAVFMFGAGVGGQVITSIVKYKLRKHL